MSQCVFARDLSVDDFEQLFEITFWPHDEDDDEDECQHLAQALGAIGPWAQWANPLDQVTDLTTGSVSIVIAPVPGTTPPYPHSDQ